MLDFLGDLLPFARKDALPAKMVWIKEATQKESSYGKLVEALDAWVHPLKDQ